MTPSTSDTPSTPAEPTPSRDEINAPVSVPEPAVTVTASASDSVVAAPAKKQAIVVYEGDERWQPPRQLGFVGNASDDEQDDQEDEDEASTVSGSDDVDHGDLLAGYESDSEVCSFVFAAHHY